MITPFQGRFFIVRVGLAMVNQCTKFDVSRFTPYEAMNGGTKWRKWGGLGWLGGTQGHRQCHHSIECTTSYSTLTETTCLILYRFRDIAGYWKSPILTYPACIWCPHGDSGRISRRSLASEKQCSWATVWCSLCDPSHFSRTPTCDRQTDTNGQRPAAGTTHA